jgi:hypothetical protein
MAVSASYPDLLMLDYAWRGALASLRRLVVEIHKTARKAGLAGIHLLERQELRSVTTQPLAHDTTANVIGLLSRT